MSLSNTYKELYNNVSADSILTFSTDRNFLLQQAKWYEGLAILDHTIDRFDDYSTAVVTLYEKLFLEELDFVASKDLDEEDYAFYFEKIQDILLRLAAYHPHAYTQLAFQFQECRRGYSDADKIKEYLFKAMDHDVPLATAVIGYFYTLGWEFIKDETLGSSYLQDLDNPWVLLYRGYIALTKNELEVIPDYVERMRSFDDEKAQRSADILQALYLQRQDRRDEAQDYFEKVLQHYASPYAYLQAGLHLMFKEEAEWDKGIYYLQQAAELGNVEAMNNLAYHSYPAQVNEKEDLSNVFYWFHKSHTYGNAYGSYRTALIYLYEPIYKDIAEGIKLMELAADENNAEAVAELAEINLIGELVEYNEKKGYELHSLAAEELGYGYSYYRLGLMEERGMNEFQTPDLEKALAHFEKASELGNSFGYSNAGRFYRYAIGTEADMEKARHYFEKGTEYGNAYCATELGFMYEDGTVDKDYVKAFALFSDAAEMQGGYPYAYFIKGQYLQNGYHTGERDEQAAFEAFERGAELGNIGAIYEQGRCYRYGMGVAEDPDRALALYHQAAEQQYVQAYVEIALCYEYEVGVSADPQKAFDWMLKAAEQDYAFAQYKIGLYYAHGSLGDPIAADIEKGREWLEKAATNGSAYANLELGDFYLYDYDQSDEVEKALAYYQKAYELGAINEGLGLCYEYAIGTPYNAGEAFKYFEAAANNGNIPSMYRLGKCYLNGNGAKKNVEQAFSWFYNAANQGNYLAQCEAGKMLMKGQGTSVNKEEGLQFLQQSADNQVAEAQFQLGNCYLMGDAVDEDESQAMYWYGQAAENGHKQAIRVVGKSSR